MSNVRILVIESGSNLHVEVLLRRLGNLLGGMNEVDLSRLHGGQPTKATRF
jgi:hypothetical protein